MSDVTARLRSRVRNRSAIRNRHSDDRDWNAARIVNRGVRYRRASVQEDDGAPAVDAASGEAFFFCGPVLRHRRSPVLASRLGESMRRRAFIVALGGAAAWPLTACAPAAMGPVTYFADPGQYEYFSCGLLAERRKFWAERELELKLLMDKAEQSSGGVHKCHRLQGRPHCCAGRNQGDRRNAARQAMRRPR